MKKLIKRLIVVAVLLVVLLVAGVIFVIAYANNIIKGGIEKGGTYAMGVPTTVDSVDLGLMGGSFGMSGFKVASPQGYTAPHFLALGTSKVQVSLGSLSKDLIEIPTFALSDIDVSLERKDSGFNYQVILDNLKKLSSGSGSAPSGPSTGPETKLIINDLTIKNVKVHADLLGGVGGVAAQALGKSSNLTITIPEIHLTNVGKTGTGVAGSGVTVSQLSSIIVQAVLNAAAENGGGILPADILGDLQGRIAGLGDLKGISDKAVGEVKAKAEEAIKNAQDQGKKAVDDATDKLKGLIPGGK